MESKIEKGTRFGKLTVVDVQKSSNGKIYYYCNCDCGRIGVVAYHDSLISGNVVSCLACKKSMRQFTDKTKKEKRQIFKKEKNPLIAHPLHRVWSSMIVRCENKKREYYHLYGGRGIKVCPEWRNSYMNFYNWAMQNGYKFETNGKNKKNIYTLDRIDINGDYCPENCRWVTYKEQGMNKRADMVVDFNGERKVIKAILKDYNATVPYFYNLLKQGNNEIQALNIIKQSYESIKKRSATDTCDSF